MSKRSLGPYTPLVYAPDLDQSWGVNRGVCCFISGYVPTKRKTWANYANGPNQVMQNTTTWALATYGTPRAAYVFKNVLTGGRFFVCTGGAKRRLIEMASTPSVTDRSKGATDYSASTVQWTMAAYGNAMIACNYYDAVQVSTSGAFADLSGSPPKAQLVATNMGFVVLADYDDGANQYGDGWACSALGNYTSWAASLATQAANGRLLATPGRIRALVSLRDSIVAYKDDSIYIGDYIGDTVNGVIWEWRLVSHNVGCSSPHGVAVYNDVHYFLHKTGVYSFDGAQVANIGFGVHKAIVSRLVDFQFLASAQIAVDDINGVIYFSFPFQTSGQLDIGLSLNLNTGLWGGNMSLGYLWQSSNANAALYAYAHATTADVIAWDANGFGGIYPPALYRTPVCVGTDDATNASIRQPDMAVDSGVDVLSNITTGWFATGPLVSFVRRIWLRLLYFGTQRANPTAVLAHLRQEGATTQAPPLWPTGVNVTPAPSWNASNYSFDVSSPGAADRLLQAQFIFNGPHEIAGAWLDMETADAEE